MYGTSIGIPFERILKKSGITHSQLMTLDGWLPQAAFLKLFQLLDDKRSAKNTAIQFSKLLSTGTFGPMGRIMERAPCFETSFQLMMQGQDLFSDGFDASIVDLEDEVLFTMHHELDAMDEGFGAELGLSVVFRLASKRYGKLPLKRVMFQHAPRSPLTIYEDFFAAPVEFNTPYNGLVLAQEHLPVESILEETDTFANLSREIEELRQKKGFSKNDGLDDIREAIAKNAKLGDYSAAGLAKSMSMSLRNLQRRVQKAGTNTRQLLDQARYDCAVKLLADHNRSIESIADDLGFESERSFRRAFSRWSGMSPSRYRKTSTV